VGFHEGALESPYAPEFEKPEMRLMETQVHVLLQFPRWWHLRLGVGRESSRSQLEKDADAILVSNPNGIEQWGNEQ
jgi:hypothetical protein